MRKWFRVEMKAEDPNVADIFIFGIIGDWIDDLMEDIGWGFDSVKTAKSFQKELDSLPENVKTIRLHVNSPGGDVFGAVAIANMLRDQRTSKGRSVEAFVEGLAASAASIVIQAGDPIRIADNGLIMIHDPFTGIVGNARELRKAADELDKITEASIIATYQWHSKLETKEIAELMAETTWLDADEAVEWGFATEKVEGLSAAASLDPKSIAKLSIPEKYREVVDALLKKSEPEPAPPKPDPKAVIEACKAAGLPELAGDLLEEPTLEAVKAKLDQAKEARAAAAARETAIRGLCKNAKIEDRADHYIRAGVTVDFVKNEIAWITAKLDKVEIDGGLDPDAGSRRSDGAINVIDIYRELNQLPAGKGA